MQQNFSDQTFATAYNPLLINSNLLQSNCLQGLSLSDMQGLQHHYQLAGLNLQNVMLNQQQQQQSLMINQPNLMLLNQQNLLLNQQANPLGLYSQNQLIQPGQQMLLTNLYSLNKNQLPAPIVMATNLISPSIIDQTSKQSKSSKKRIESSEKSIKLYKEPIQVDKRIVEESVYNEAEMSESDLDDDQDTEEEYESEDWSDEEDSDIEMINNDQKEDSDEKSIQSNNERESEYGYEEMTHDFSAYDLKSSTNDFSSNLDENTNSSCSSNSKEMMFQIPDLRCVKKEPKSLSSDELNFEKLSDEELKPFLDEIRIFARKFKTFRCKNNITQDDVSKEISEFISCSQSKLCRFEKYRSEKVIQKVIDKNKKRLKAVLKTKDALENYIMYKKNNLIQPKDCNDKIRKKRINFKPDQAKILNDFFEETSHPTPQQIIELSTQTNHSEKEIKIWFNNKRQSQKQKEKKMFESQKE